MEYDKAGEGVDEVISEEELDGILDRERIFADTAQWGKEGQFTGAASTRWGKPKGENGDHVIVPLPREGAMYDVVDD
ncbi:unnamed protein product, partial [Choristocarpus tenellus]